MQGAPTKCACKCNRDCVIEGCFATNMNNIKKYVMFALEKNMKIIVKKILKII